MQTIWLDAVEFDTLGGWKKESQFVRSVGQSYLIASDKPGTPVDDAKITFSIKEEATYRFFVRTKNWKHPEAPGRFALSVNGEELPNILGKMPTHQWYWEIAGDLHLTAGSYTLSVVDKTGWFSRFADVVITSDMDFTPSPEVERMLRQRAEIKGIENKTEELHFDFVVVGAGPAGVPCAIEAARCGLKTALISGRPTIGGNASNEGSVSMDGASSHHRGTWEGGILNEIRNLNVLRGITNQAAMEYLCANEPNLTVFTNEICIDANSIGSHIISATTVNAQTLFKKTFFADRFADCTGDGWLGYYAGAAYRIGREAKWQHDESFAPQVPDTLTMSGCICGTSEKLFRVRTFRAEKTDSPVSFQAPDWAIKLPEGEALHRKVTDLHCAAWWMENSNDFDDLWDDEFARDELIRLGIGYFHWLKNSAPLAPHLAAEVDYYELCEMALHTSKRENRRLIGDYVFNQNDCVEGKRFPDAISYCGWNLDVHHPKGIYSGAEGAFLSDAVIPCTPLPYRMIYSKNIDNLFIGGRCCSATHVGLGTVRVEATLATLGQAAGVAAYLCKKYGTTPRGIYESHIKELQQLLLRHDLSIPYVTNEDSLDLARSATVTADSIADDVYLLKHHGTKDVWAPINTETFTSPYGVSRVDRADYYKAELKNVSGHGVELVAKLWKYSQRQDINDSAKLIESCKITLEPEFEGYLDIPFETKDISQNIAVSIEPTQDVLWRKRIWTKGSFLSFERRENEIVEISDDARELLISSDIEMRADCSAENVINGVNRPSLTKLNGWVSNRSAGLPASITLTLARPENISEVRITTKAELSYPDYAYKRNSAFVGMAQDLSISLLRNGEWHNVATVTDNCYKQMVARFESQLAEAVRITVTKARHDVRAHITEVRIYE